MKRKLAVLVSGASLIAAVLCVGCDRTISKEETTKVKDDGTVKTTEKTVKESPDGTVTKSEETKKTKP